MSTKNKKKENKGVYGVGLFPMVVVVNLIVYFKVKRLH